MLRIQVADGDLFEKVLDGQRDQLPEGVTRCIMQQVLQAVKHLHALDVTHRDIK